MRDHKTMRNITFAFGFFVLWGNIISFFLPADQFGTVIKMVDFASLLYIMTVLINEFSLSVKNGSGKKQRDR